jgi:intracellular multiplication protein IcmP
MPDQQQQQQGQDNSLDFLWLIGGLIVAVYLCWYFGKVYIVSTIFHVRFYEIIAINYVLDLLAKLMQLIGLPQFQITLNEPLLFIQHNIHGIDINFSTLTQLSTIVGNYIRYPLTLLMLGGATLLYFGGSSHRFRHVFGTKELEELEQENWPQIKPVVGLNLVKQPLDEKPWAMALSPMNFCKKNELLDVETKNGKYIATLRSGAAYRILSLQLGPKWYGAEALPPHLKALFAIFAARINNDKKSADNLLDQLSISSATKKLDYTGTDKLIRKHINSKDVAKIINLHGYITGILASMLVGARAAGVLATAEFIWLKPLNRQMWYMLNSVGRPTAVAEISGAFAHWLAEKKLGLPLTVPMVEEAVRGLELALGETIYKPEEE